MSVRLGLALNVCSVKKLHECKGKHYLSEPQYSYLKLGVSNTKLLLGFREMHLRKPHALF